MKEIPFELQRYQLVDLLRAAIKSEKQSRALYAGLSRQVRNAFLKERLGFLAGEENKHKKHLEAMFHDLFPDRKLILPRKPVVPLPQLTIGDERVPLSQVLQKAMDAEEAAYNFYKQLALLFPNDIRKRNLLGYFAAMEMSHYQLLESEKQNTERLEEFGEEQEMVHVGP